MKFILLLLIVGLMILNFSITASVANPVPDESTPKIGQFVSNDSTKFNPDVRAAEFLRGMNLTVKPCDNFYEFVCGNYMTSDESRQSSIFIDQVSSDLENILAEVNPPGELQAFKNVRNFYQACMNSIEPAGENDLHTLKEILSELGGWPMLEGSNWREDEFNWSSFIVKLSAIKSNVFFYFSCWTSHSCMLKPSISIFMHDQLTNKIHDPTVNVYFQRVETYFSKMGGDPETIRPEFFEEIFHFDAAMFELFQSLRDDSTTTAYPIMYLTSKSQYKMSLDDLITKYPEIQFLDLTAAQIYSKSHQIAVRGNGSVQSIPGFIDKLIKLINQTPKRTLANYALIRLIASKTGSSYAKIIPEKTSYFTDLGLNACLHFIDITLPLAKDALYVKKYFSSHDKNKMNQLISDIKDQTKKQLEKIDSLDGEIIQIMREAIEEIEVSFGYPDEIFDYEQIQKFYDGLVIPENDFLQGYYEFYLYKLRSFKKSSSLDIYKNWLNYTTLMNPLKNSRWSDDIRVPAGFLHGSFFHSNQPNYLNYAGAGEYIGTTLGIISSNAVKDIKELLKQKLDKLYCKQFHTRQILFHEESDNRASYYSLLDEYFEQLGMNIAYSAYKNWLGRSKIEEPKLPAMNYTSEQMFWINLMHQKCSKYSSKSWKFYINDLVNVMDSSGFREAFGCPNLLENPICPAFLYIGN